MMKRRTFVACAAAAALGAAAVVPAFGAGAAEKPAAGGTAEETGAQDGSAARVTDNGDGTRTVVDMVGREVVVPAVIEKIGTLGSVPVVNGFVELVGAGDRICNNLPPNFRKNDTWKYQFEFAPQLMDCPNFEESGEILFENILQTGPDVCIVMEQAKAEQLQEKGIATICLSWTDNEDVKDAVELLGAVLGCEEQAAAYVAYFDETVERAAQLTAGLKDDEKRRVLAGVVPNLEYPLLIGEWWLEKAGAKSVTANGRTDEVYYVNYSVEDLLKWDPEVIITNRSSHIPTIYEDKQFQGLTAVIDGEVYASPCVAHIWANRTVEQPLMIFWAVNKIYPELFGEEDLAAEIKGFYSTFFGYEMTDEQVDAIIHTPQE